MALVPMGKKGRLVTGVLGGLLVLRPAFAHADAAPDPAPEPVSGRSASGFPPGWLEWSAPPECPGTDHVESRIVEWLGAPPPPTVALAVESTALWTEAGWEVRVIVRLGQHVGERRVRLETCRDAADFVALTVALAVNPDLDPGAVTLSEWIESPPADAPAAAPSLSPLVEEPEPETTSKSTSQQATARPEPRRPLAVLLGAGAEMSMGALPGIHGGVSLEAGLATQRGALWLGGRFLPPSNEVFEAAAAPIDFSLVAARAGASLDLISGPASLGPRVVVELGNVRAGQVGAALAAPEDSAFWAALALGLEFGVSVRPWLEPLSSLEISVPLTRPRFLLDDGTLLHQATVGFRAELGVRILLWTR